MSKEVKKCSGKMCVKRCCGNCTFFNGTHPSSDEEEWRYYLYKGWCAVSKEDCTADNYCSDWGSYQQESIMKIIVKKCYGKMSETRCCDNCYYFRGERANNFGRPASTSRGYCINYEWTPTVTGDHSCAEWRHEGWHS